MAEILILYYSRHGAVQGMAQQIARGVEMVPGMQARLRSVPPVAPAYDSAAESIPASGAPYAVSVLAQPLDPDQTCSVGAGYCGRPPPEAKPQK